MEDLIMKKILLITLITSCFVIISSAQIIHVPADQPTIQAGINAATTGDTVLVAPETYFENIRFMGKAITLASEFINDSDTSHIFNTIIDGSQATDPDSSATVMFLNYEDSTSIINGFTITGGSGVLSTFYNIRKGGGIFCNNAGALIMNNRIIENHLNHENKAGGAGIGCQSDDGDHWIIIRNNNISYNSSTTIGISAYGAGIHASINTIIENNLIEYNQCENTGSYFADGGAIEIEQYPGDNIITEITNNIIRHNSIEGYDCFGGGIVIIRAKANLINNSIKFNTVVAEHNGNGGGIYFDSPLESAKLLNNDISDNTINGGNYGRGGGVAFWNPREKLIMIENKVNNNITEADECRGTGVLFRCNQYPVGEIQVLHNEFIGNLGNLDANNCNGGGVCLNDAYDTLVVFDGNRFDGNTAILGGGLYSRRSYNLKVTNNIFSNNTSVNGGGLRLRHYESSKKATLHPQIVNNTLYNNYSDFGGGICLSCEINVPVIFNNIFWENESPNYNDIYYDDSGIDSIFVSYNNIDEDEIYGPWTGIGNINEDPLFVDPENGDFHLDNCESPCINVGIDALEINSTLYYCPINDIDNETRPYENTLPDIGADETPCLETSIENHEDVSSSTILNNFPNPFKDQTTIEFNILQSGFIILSIVDFTGKEIQSLVSKQLPAGTHQFDWNAKILPAGIYFLRLETNGIFETRKLLLMR